MKKDADIADHPDSTSDTPSIPQLDNVGRVITRTYGTRLKDYGTSRQGLEMENFDLIAKVIELLTTHDLWEPDGTYSFEDGERWAKLEELDEDATDEVC